MLKILIKEYICITVICIQMMHGHIATILLRLSVRLFELFEAQKAHKLKSWQYFAFG